MNWPTPMFPAAETAKRYQDVQDILAAGIHVLSALNIQHLESLYNTVEQLIGVKVRERIPDSVLAEADQIVNIDLAAEDLQKRLKEGKIYPKERVASSLENFFTESNLEHLRELALRELASQLDFKRRETSQEKQRSGEQRRGAGPDHGLSFVARAQQRPAAAFCIASGGPAQSKLVCGLRADAVGRTDGDRRDDAASAGGHADAGQPAWARWSSRSRGRTWRTRFCGLPRNIASGRS